MPPLSHPSSEPLVFFFFNDTATTEIYTLSLHDALPILSRVLNIGVLSPSRGGNRLFQHTVYLSEIDVAEYWRDHPALGNSFCPGRLQDHLQELRSEEHTSELQSRLHLVCRLLLEKKKTQHCD